MKQKVVTVIPIHKAAPTHNEIASFVQCYNILGTHPIRIIAPEGLDVAEYRKAVPDCEFVFIDPHWLSSIEQYNKLKISLYFYNLFKDYEYLLTYELDAWVFRDELLYWCEKGYDYIGAPWFEGYSTGNSINFLKGGNSGFSLRKVRKAIEVLNTIKKIKLLRNFWYRSRLQAISRIENNLISLFLLKSRKHWNLLFHDWHELHEDYYWSKLIADSIRNYKVAPSDISFKFSFECNPEFLHQKNNKTLPFGCHAWEKYEPNFWKRHINV